MKNIFIFLMYIVLVGCTDYLDLKPYGKTIPKTAEEYSAMIHSMIDIVEQDVQSDKNNMVTSINGAITLEGIADNLDANIFFRQDILSFYPRKEGNYSGCYENVRNCNIVIEGLKDDNSELARTVKGVAHTFRALSYFNLMQHYCKPVENGTNPALGLALVDQFDMEARPIRSSFEQTIKFIENDYNKALEYNVQNKDYLFTAETVNFFKARLYHWIAQWDKVLEMTESYVENYPIAGRDEFSSMIVDGTVKPNMILKYNKNRTLYGTVDRVYNSFNNRVIGKEFIDLFEEKEHDIRFIEYMNKYRRSIKLYIGAIRVEEMLLCRAEAFYHKGENQKALDLINKLRRSRILNYEDITLNNIKMPNVIGVIKKDALGKELTPLMALIINERRKELFMEGDRHFELKRNGSPERWIRRDVIVFYTYKYMYTSPIPYSELLLTPGMQQNEGWTVFED